MSGLGLDPVLFLMACVIVALLLAGACLAAVVVGWLEREGVPTRAEIASWLWGD